MNRQLRFCMITTFYPPYNFGGDGIYVHALSNELAQRGHRVDIIHCKDAYHSLAGRAPVNTYPNHPNVRVHGLSSPFGFLSPLATQQTGYPLFKSARILEILRHRFDVIHYHNISLIGGPKILQYGEAIKLVTMHDYWLVCATHALFRLNRAPCTKPHGCFVCTLIYKRPPQWWRYSNLLQTAIKSVDAFIAPSLTSQRKHEQLGLKGKIVHIPNFTAAIKSGSASGPSDTGAPGEPYFLFVGRLEKLKGLETIIPVFRRYDKAQLWIAGSGSEERTLRKMAHPSSNIRFLGYQSGEPLQALYRNALAVIYPSVNFQTGISKASVTSGQGAPLVIMEAFSQKTPVLAARAGTISAILEQSGGGIVYSTEAELFAAMDQLLGDSSYRDKLGLYAYTAYQQKWTIEAHLDRYFALIDEIAASRQSRNDSRCSGFTPTTTVSGERGIMSEQLNES